VADHLRGVVVAAGGDGGGGVALADRLIISRQTPPKWLPAVGDDARWRISVMARLSVMARQSVMARLSVMARRLDNCDASDSLQGRAPPEGNYSP
jgi:hypothetical protein